MPFIRFIVISLSLALPWLIALLTYQALSPTTLIGILLFTTTLLSYLFSAAGYIDTLDADPSLETARALYGRLSFNLMPGIRHEAFYHYQHRGALITKLGLTMPILYLPAIAISNWTHAHWGYSQKRVEELVVSFINPILSAAVVGLLFSFLRLEGLALEKAAFFAYLAAFATLLFPYSKTSQREPMQALCLLGFYLFATHATALPSTTLAFFLAGLFAGLTLLTKLAAIVPLLPGFFLLLLTAMRTQDVIYHLGVFALPFSTAMGLWLLFAKLHYGSFRSTGYSDDVTKLSSRIWQYPFLRGFWIQWASMRHGFFWYQPVLLWALPITAYRIYHFQFTILEACLLSAIVLRTSVYAKWKWPHGDQALGPRYLVAIIPLSVILLAKIPDHFFHSMPLKIVFYLSLTLSLLFNFIHTSIKSQQYWNALRKSEYQLRHPQWLFNIIVFLQKAFIQRYAERHLPQSTRGFNYWWAHALRRL